MTFVDRAEGRLSADASSQLAQLGERWALPESALSALRKLLALLVFDDAAPTNVRNERAVIDDHLADGLVALELTEVRAAKTIADLGSGAGLPGLVLAAALPETEVALVEGNRRKAMFLNRATAATGLANARVVNERAELWRDGLERLDVVAARALAPLPVVAEYAAPLLVVGGALVVWRGARDREEEEAAGRAAPELGLRIREPLPVKPYSAARHRHLHLMVKVSPTPARFPRRPGMAAKRPLGGAGRPDRV